MRWWEACVDSALGSARGVNFSALAPLTGLTTLGVASTRRKKLAVPRDHIAPAYQWSRHGDARVCYAPGSFLQANTEAYNALLSAVRRHVPAVRRLRALRRRGGAASWRRPRLRETPFPYGAWRSWRRRGRRSISPRARRSGPAPRGTRVWRRRVPRRRRRRRRRPAVRARTRSVVDPPRKGLDARTLAALAGHDPAFTNVHGRSGKNRGGPAAREAGRRGLDAKSETNATAALRRNVTSSGDRASSLDDPAAPARLRTLIYVSCGFASFERDCDALVRSGQWALRHAEGFNFFPGSDALETLAVFRKRGGWETATTSRRKTRRETMTTMRDSPNA